MHWYGVWPSQQGLRLSLSPGLQRSSARQPARRFCPDPRPVEVKVKSKWHCSFRPGAPRLPPAFPSLRSRGS